VKDSLESLRKYFLDVMLSIAPSDYPRQLLYIFWVFQKIFGANLLILSWVRKQLADCLQKESIEVEIFSG